MAYPTQFNAASHACFDRSSYDNPGLGYRLRALPILIGADCLRARAGDVSFRP